MFDDTPAEREFPEKKAKRLAAAEELLNEIGKAYTSNRTSWFSTKSAPYTWDMHSKIRTWLGWRIDYADALRSIATERSDELLNFMDSIKQKLGETPASRDQRAIHTLLFRVARIADACEYPLDKETIFGKLEEFDNNITALRDAAKLGARDTILDKLFKYYKNGGHDRLRITQDSKSMEMLERLSDKALIGFATKVCDDYEKTKASLEKILPPKDPLREAIGTIGDDRNPSEIFFDLHKLNEAKKSILKLQVHLPSDKRHKIPRFVAGVGPLGHHTIPSEIKVEIGEYTETGDPKFKKIEIYSPMDSMLVYLQSVTESQISAIDYATGKVATNRASRGR